jgi:8-oxo-dGTP pyrophosphatase MutT (NUDIX family)
MIEDPPLPRDAASLILVRRDAGGPRVLMGQRGSSARFMPSKFVFPGGAIDAGDAGLQDAARLSPLCETRLAEGAPEGLGLALARAAIRETFEETGLALGQPDADARSLAASAPAPWRGFLGRGLRPALDRLTFLMRAITPPTRPVRFDARFFLADAAHLTGDPDDFSDAEDELAHLSWLTLTEARRLDLPFITTVVLAEVERALDEPERRAVPFFRHEGGRSFIDAIR